MASSKTNKISAGIFCILNAYYSKTHLIKALNSLDTSIPNGILSQNTKNRGFREACSAENIPQKHADFGNQPKTWNLGLNFFSHALLHMNSL